MSRMTITAQDCPSLSPAQKTKRGSSLSNLLIWAFDTFGNWHERAQQRRALASASDHVLRDIGVSRLDVEFEVGKPFWRP